MKRKTVEEDINDFMECVGDEGMTQFLKDSFALIELYNVTQEDDWIKEAHADASDHEVRKLRIIRTAYLLSRFAEFNAGKMVELKMRWKDLWRRMEKEAEKEN